MQNVLPRYEVEPLKGTVKRPVTRVSLVEDEDTGKKVFKREETFVEEPAGYMVYLANGGSLRVRNDAELKRLGFDAPATLVDMETSDELPAPNTSLKVHNKRMTQQSSRPQSEE